VHKHVSSPEHESGSFFERFRRRMALSLKAGLSRTVAALSPQNGSSDGGRSDSHFTSLINLSSYVSGWIRYFFRRVSVSTRRPLVRNTAIGFGGVFFLGIAVCLGLWWRLSTGPIALDLATPWLTAAIEENLGSGYRINVGGTQLERDEQGRPALRIRDIVVRDAAGALVASAPKAEVGFSGAGLLTGRLRAERLSLVGAEMALRIEADGQLTLFAGADRQPIATAPGIGDATKTPSVRETPPLAQIPSPQTPLQAPSGRTGPEQVAAVLAWLDGLGGLGLDGRDLVELGLKHGSLKIDDRRNGKTWTFEKINLSVTRPKAGGIAVNVGSESAERPWLLSAAITASGYGKRALHIEARKVSCKDLLLALRLDEGQWQADLPVSAVIDAELGTDGTVRAAEGRVIVEAGTITETDDVESRVAIEGAEFRLDWDANRRTLLLPFHVRAGTNRITLLAQIETPREANGPWTLGLGGGSVLLGSSGASDTDPPLLLERFNMRARLDLTKRHLELEQGDFQAREMGVAFSGGLDFSGAEPRLAVGVAGQQMSVSVLKRLWPPFLAPVVRTWVLEHVESGWVERVVIATNAPMPTLKASGPPVPDDGLSIEVATTGTTIRPVDGLPAIREADLTVRITGRSATVMVPRGVVEVSPGRKITVSNGVFEVPDTFPKGPLSRARFKLEGSVPAVAELLNADRLRDASGPPVDPASSRGNVTAQVAVQVPLKRDIPKGATTYSMTADITNFVAERMVMGQKVEAPVLRVTAGSQGYQIKGDVKINGTPAVLEYKKPRSDSDAEISVRATLDEAARGRLGFDLGSMVTGPVPVKLGGRLTSNDRDTRFNVEADLTPAKIDNLLPGWTKPAGRAARASFVMIKQAQATRFEDLLIEGSGASVKGTVELDAAGELQYANFPNFSLADGDKANLRAERATDGTLKVTLRGDVYDGRGFVKSSMGSSADAKGKNSNPANDLDLDVKLGVVAGHNGEALRGLDVKLSRRAGQIRSFALSGKLGRDTPLIGDLRSRGAGRDSLYLETNDAGALFRFADIYAKMHGGQMWVAMDPPSADHAPKEGILNVRDFSVRGEGALENVASTSQANGSPVQQGGTQFSRMRLDFTRTTGKLTIRDGLVRGPAIGATIEGQLDYQQDAVRLRGTFVPLYGLNNMFGQLPIIGVFLGGSNEGLLGITYEVVGTPAAPMLRVNPLSAVAPGLLRKLFEFPTTSTSAQQEVREFR
jgi:hypothetical protein